MYALAFLRRVIRAAERLREFPSSGRVVPEFNDDTLREVIFQNYRVIYRLAGEDVYIVAAWHAAVDVKTRLEARPWDLT